jgi:pimeloyl-ACP methyl ester carboxylesterase
LTRKGTLVALADRHFETIETNGVKLRCVVEGEGPLIILLHGWPQCWYLWRHQIDPLLNQGWKVCVPDQRGYGYSDCPPEIGDYGVRELAADVDGLATALGYDEYALMIHDWGALVGWNVALLYPDRVRAVVGMSVPYGRNLDPAWCTQDFWGENFFYWAFFCENVGGAEAHLEADIRTSLLTIHVSASGDAGPPVSQVGKTTMLEASPRPPAELPSWMTPEDLDYYVAAYSKSGFRGGLNWYRNFPTFLQDTIELEGRKIVQPSIFITGSEDPVRKMTGGKTGQEHFEDLRSIHVIDGPGHWVQLEAVEETNTLVLEFLSNFA